MWKWGYAFFAGPQSARAATAAAEAADSNDDDILMDRELDLDTVLARRRQDAICNGQLIDLAADVDDQQLQRCIQRLCTLQESCTHLSVRASMRTGKPSKQ